MIMAEDRNWGEIDYSLPSVARSPHPPLRVGVKFTETMKGYFSTQEKEDHERAEKLGKGSNSKMQFILTILSRDVDEMVNNPEYLADLVGTVQAEAVSPDPLTVAEGHFSLFLPDPEQPSVRHMIYRMKLVTEEGKFYFFDGFKEITEAPVTKLWEQTTTLFVTLHEGEDQSGPVLGRGILRIEVLDFAKQLSTMRAINAPGQKAGAEAVVKFGKYFGGVLFEQYGGILAKASVAT